MEISCLLLGDFAYLEAHKVKHIIVDIVVTCQCQDMSFFLLKPKNKTKFDIIMMSHEFTRL